MTIINPNREIYVSAKEPEDTLSIVKKLYPSAISVDLKIFDLAYRNIGFELKSWSDFVKAITDKNDKRYRNQLYNILQTLESNPELNAFYFIHGDWKEINEFSHINMNAVLGAIASIEARYRIRCNIFPNKVYAIYVACKIIEKSSDGKHVSPQTYRVLTEDRGRNMLLNSAERLSSHAVDNLLTTFGTVKEVVNQPIEELIKVDGIGKVSAERIIQTVTFDYKKKAEFEQELNDEINFNFDIEKDKIHEKNNIKDEIYNSILEYSSKGLGINIDSLCIELDYSKDVIKKHIRELLIESQVYVKNKELYIK